MNKAAGKKWSEMNTLHRVFSLMFPNSKISSGMERSICQVSILFEKEDGNAFTTRTDVRLLADRMGWCIADEVGDKIHLFK